LVALTPGLKALTIGVNLRPNGLPTATMTKDTP
jgi:hypothetical protein